MSDINSSDSSLRVLLFILFKRKTLITGVFIFGVLALLVFLLLKKPVYSANAKILVKIGNQNILDSTRGDRNAAVFIQQMEVINSEKELIKSRILAEKVLLEVGIDNFTMRKNIDDKKFISRLTAQIQKIEKSISDLFNDNSHLLGKGSTGTNAPTEVDQAIDQFLKSLNVNSITKSNLINIQFDHQNPVLASQIANNLVAKYIERHLDIHKTRKSYNFFKDQADSLSEKVKKQKHDLDELLKSNDITSFDEEQSLLLRQRAAMEDELNKALSYQIETKKKIGKFFYHKKKVPTTIPQGEQLNPNELLINTLEARLVELELRKNELTDKYSDENRLIRNINSEIALVKAKLKDTKSGNYEKTTTSGVNPNYQHLERELYTNEAELIAVNSKITKIAEQLAGFEDRLTKLNIIEKEYIGLKRQYEIDNENLTLYLGKLEEARISDAMDKEKITSVQVVEPASNPIYPNGPGKKLIFSVGSSVFIIIGIIFAIGIEVLQRRLDRPEDVENYLGLPVLASIAHVGRKTK